MKVLNGGGGGGEITVNDHTGEAISTGVATLEWQTLDKLGFTAVVDATDPSKVIIGEAPEFLDAVVWSSAQTTDVRVSVSDIAEADKFETQGWENTTVKGAISDYVYRTTVGRGFGPESSLVVKTYYDGDLVDDETFTASANGTTTQGNVSVQVSDYGPDGDGSVFKGKFTVVIDADGLIGSSDSGPTRVEIEFTEQKWAGRESINQNVFRDKNPATPRIDGDKLIDEPTDAADMVLKYISGIGYFTLSSPFDISVADIMDHNEDTSKPKDSLEFDSGAFGISDYASSPWTAATKWGNVSNLDTAQNLTYDERKEIDITNFRHVGDAKLGITVSDSWNDATEVFSNTLRVCIDTVSNPSTDLIEYFDEENKRLQGDYTTAWDSTRYCADGEAIFFGGKCYHGADLPRILENVEGTIGTGGSLSSTLPDREVNGNPRQNPNYAVHVKPAVHFREFITPDAASYAVFTMNITTNGDLQAQLDSGDLKIYIWKLDCIDITTPNIILPNAYNTANPTDSLANSIWAHEAYDFANFDDGATPNAAGSGCRANLTGNLLEVTTGGFSLLGGVLVRFEQAPGVVIEEVSVDFI
ncbi:hypothetical protein [Vibrio phage VCPH]|nr:hypothetical protein [Vibrio phage VCPH]